MENKATFWAFIILAAVLVVGFIWTNFAGFTGAYTYPTYPVASTTTSTTNILLKPGESVNVFASVRASTGNWTGMGSDIRTITLDKIGSDGAIMITVNNAGKLNRRIIGAGNTNTVGGLRIKNSERFYSRTSGPIAAVISVYKVKLVSP